MNHRPSNLNRRSFLHLASAIALTGCNSPEHAANELSVWSMWSGQEEKNFHAVLDRYSKLNPTVKFRNLSAVSDDTKTVRAIVAGAPPDLFTLSDASYLGALAHNGALRPLDDLFAKSVLKIDSFVPASLDLCRYNGKLYGIPFLIDVTALMWDKKAFAEAGLDPDRPPSTMEQLAEYSVRLTQRDSEGKITRLGLRPFTDLYMAMKMYGGQLADMHGTVTPDHPGNVAGLRWYKNIVAQVGGIEKVNAFSSGFGRDQGASNPFYVGKVAMMFNGEWNPYWLSRYAPQMRYGVSAVPPPASHPERLGTTWAGGNVFCMPKESKRVHDAWAFLEWTQTLEAQTLFALTMNNVPNQLEALKVSSLRDGAPFRRQFATFLDIASAGQVASFPALSVTTMYMNQLNNAIDRVMFGEKTAEVALAEVRVNVQKELDRA